MNRFFCYILGMRVDCMPFEKTVNLIMDSAMNGTGGYVCLGNVHMVIETFNSPQFRDVVNSAMFVMPDGVPLVWGLKLLGIKRAERVCGPALTLAICQKAQELKISVGFIGGEEYVLQKMKKELTLMYPTLNITYTYSPPFRILTNEEDEKITNEILLSGTKILFVGLGCPKQEIWMSVHRHKTPVVMVGVGAAFDFIGGKIKRAPKFIQQLGLEWSWRLIQEPRRLWKRYIIGNVIFISLILREFIKLVILKKDAAVK